MRMLARFEKREPIRHISHLDVHRTMARALRRSGLPVAYSAGFNPHALIAFASALPVGMYGTAEVLDVTLTEAVAPAAFVERLNAALPEALRVREARAVSDRFPAPMGKVAYATFDARLLGDGDAARRCLDAVSAFLSRAEIPAIKRGKKGPTPIDLRPLIAAMEVEGGDRITMRLSHREGASIKPDVVVQALASEAGVEGVAAVIGCTGLWTERGEDVYALRDPEETADGE